MTCVSARGLTRRFGDRVALDAVDVDVQPGRVVGLVGPNGAGKTTLLHAMLGWLHVDGELRVLGMDPWHNRTALMRSVSFVADVSTVPRWLKVSQALSYVEGVHPRFERARTEALLETTGIRRGDRVGQLSKGMIAQLQLALAMGVDAPLMLLDEPTTGLDPLYRHQFYEMLLERFAEGDRTVVIATHDVDELQHMLTDLLFLDNGRVVFRCTADEYEEHRWLWSVPLVIGAIVVTVFTGVAVSHRASAAPAELAGIFDLASRMLLMTGTVVAFVYCAEALHGERRDRAILFWKSWPVGDGTAVAAKAMVALIVVPAVTLALLIAAEVIAKVVLTGKDIELHAPMANPAAGTIGHVLFYRGVGRHWPMPLNPNSASGGAMTATPAPELLRSPALWAGVGLAVLLFAVVARLRRTMMALS